MIVSPDILRKETTQCLGQINEQIKIMEAQAEELGIPPHRMTDANGSLSLTPLLLAKVMAINTLVELNYNLGRRGSRS